MRDHHECRAFARKGDGEPGVKTIWPGMQRIADFVAGIRYMREVEHQTCVEWNGFYGRFVEGATGYRSRESDACKPLPPEISEDSWRRFSHTKRTCAMEPTRVF